MFNDNHSVGGPSSNSFENNLDTAFRPSGFRRSARISTTRTGGKLTKKCFFSVFSSSLDKD